MQLVCAIVGIRTDPFTVDIDADKSVHDLKEVIKASHEDIKTPTGCIQLFLAKNRDGWLRDDENLKKMLQKPVDISEMKKMRARMKLNDPRLFGSDVSLFGEGVVHVLVFLGWEFILNDTVEASHPRKRRWDKLNEVLAKNKKVKTHDSTGFSCVSFPEISSILEATPYEPLSKPIPDDKFAAVDLYFPLSAKVIRKIDLANDSRQLYFIMPVLATVCALFDDAEILVDKAVVGERVKGNGIFTFVLKRGDKCVCVKEVKNGDVEQGIAQAYVGSEALADVEGMSVVYSIVTDLTRWVFSRSLDDKIERSATVMLAWEIKGGASGSCASISEENCWHDLRHLVG